MADKILGDARLTDDYPEGEYVLPAATTSTLGGVKPDGTTITVAEDGTIQAVPAEVYNLPAATTSTLGGVKPDGTTISVDADGTIKTTYKTVTDEDSVSYVFDEN